MSVLTQLASALDRRDDVPNKELARRLAEARDVTAIAELAANLGNDDSAVQSDCIKVLYEIGYLAPDLIAPHAADFLQLLRSGSNRLVWGGMTALSTVAALRADELYPHMDKIQRAIERGSVITVDAGVKVLADIAAANPEYNRAIIPYLFDHLRTCRPKDAPQHAEKVLAAIDATNSADFIAIIEKRLSYAANSQQARLRRVIKKAHEK
ncbi:MAG: hypothetical protein JXB30_00995 [Anaerolineae bacterium]|nr:hypothetical protein [Anaerolineae bacterium]